jgi:hypothetical protein
MKTQIKKRKPSAINSFFEGFGSVIDISGPDSGEYFILYESNSKKAISANWYRVGEEIRNSIKVIDSELISKW